MPGEVLSSSLPETPVQGTVGERPRTRPTMAEITNRTIATKKMILAISTAVPATPPNPSTAAISATTRKVSAQPSMRRTPCMDHFRGEPRLPLQCVRRESVPFEMEHYNLIDRCHFGTL